MLGVRTPLVVCAALALGATSCKRKEAARPADASAPSPASAASAAPLALDGPFAATLSVAGEPVVVASAAQAPALGLVTFDAAGEKARPLAVRLPAGATFKMVTGVSVFADGRALVAVADPLGGVAGTMVAADGTASPLAPVGVESCATAETFYFVDRDAHAVRGWRSSAPTSTPIADTKADDGATLLCGKRTAFVMAAEKRGLAMTVIAPGAAPRRVLLAPTLDPTSAGDFSAFVTDDRAGLVYAGDDDVVHVSQVTEDGAASDRAFKRKLRPAESIVGADASGDDVVALVQHEEKGRCGDEETPPAYVVLDLGRDRAFPLPKVSCDVESSPPTLEVAGGRTVVRWFESKDDGHEKRLRQWVLPLGETNERVAAVTSTAVPDSASLLDCATRCADALRERDCTTRCSVVAREGASFRIVSTLP